MAYKKALLKITLQYVRIGPIIKKRAQNGPNHLLKTFFIL